MSTIFAYKDIFKNVLEELLLKKGNIINLDRVVFGGVDSFERQLFAYCSGIVKPKNKIEEQRFLQNNEIAYLIGKKSSSVHSSKIGEWCVQMYFNMKNISYSTNIKINIPWGNYLIADGMTEKYYVEVKSLTYFTSGTAPEKLDAIFRKYRGVFDITGRKVLIILCANQQFEKNGKEILQGFYDPNIDKYLKEQVCLWKKMGFECISFKQLIS